MKHTYRFITCTFLIFSLVFTGCPAKKINRKKENISSKKMLSMITQITDEQFSNTTIPSETHIEEKFTEPTFPEETPSIETEPEITEPEPSSLPESEPIISEPAATQIDMTVPNETVAEKPSSNQTNSDDIQEYIDNIRKEYGAVGIQVAIVDNGKIAGSYNSGWATIDQELLESDHKLRVASLSKIIIGIVAMQLQENGIITTDSEIGPIWGVTARSSNYPDTPITIETILTHTSTISDFGNQADMDYESVLARLPNSFTGAKPGKIANYYYNNYAFRLLGMTLEIAAGQTLDQYLQNGMFASMDIDAAFASGDLKNTDNLATLYWEGDGVARSLSYQKNIHGPSFPGGNGYHYSGGLTISATDLAKILCMLVNDGYYNGKQYLTSESISYMEDYISTRLYDGTYQAHPMVYVPDIYDRDGIYFHTGSGWGVYNCFSYDPETGDGVIVLTNGASSGGTNPSGIYYVCSDINNYIYGLIQ